MFRHPKYYKELRKRALDERNREPVIICSAAPNTDQAISDEASTEATSVRPGPGPKRQASSVKPQAPEASSDKHQAPSNKRQA